MQLIIQLRGYKAPLNNNNNNDNNHHHHNNNSNNVVKVKVVKNSCKKLGGYNPLITPPEKGLNYY